MSKGILAIGFLAGTVAVYFLLISPIYFTDIKALELKRDSFNEALSNSREVQKKRDDLLVKYTSISKDDLDRLDKILPNQPGAMKFILEMENISQRNGVVMKNIEVKDTGNKASAGAGEGGGGSVQSIPFSMSVTSPYASFRSFLKDIERDLRLTDINSMRVSAGEKDFYEFNLTGTFYWSPVK